MDNFGIYTIVNILTGDLYIGSTIESFKKRKNKHISSYNAYRFKNKRAMHPLLYNAIDKYGIDCFEFKILYEFETRKENTRSIVLKLEERLIKNMKPKYNICQEPTKSGSPNLGRKLTKDWKNNIRLKSKKYKHDKETLKIVTNNNKKNSSVYLINNEFKGSLIDCAKHYGVHSDTILNRFKGLYDSDIIKSVVKLKSQKKKIKLFNEHEVLSFNSFSECDSFFNMWRGYTSTLVTRGENKIKNYYYQVLNDDIV